MALEVGTHLGPYEILGRLGTGGMGEVYKAMDTRLGRTVAIKRLLTQQSDRFQDEARAIAALNHPHICQIHDVGADYLVLEYIEGAPLGGPLPERDALRLAIQIADAVTAVHGRGVLHRDLKPANIMVTTAGAAKLLDFGIAKHVVSDADVTRTIDGAVVGTAAYMSPEQAEGNAVDERSDIFSFGAVLYELLSGRSAFGGHSTARVLGAVLRDDPLPLGASPAVERIVRRCLEKQPQLRFQTMAEVKTALEEVASGTAPRPADRQPSIAVLPFADMSPGKDHEWFSDGLAEEILNALTRVAGLKVTARTSAFSFRGEKQDIRKIGDALDVRTVLEGSVRSAGSRIRVTAQLIDVASGFHLWSERFDRDMTDVFAVQDEVALAIVDTLQVKLTAGTSVSVRKPGNVEAYHAYLKGRHHFERLNPSDAARGEAYFKEAIARDPSYAPAYAALSQTFISAMGATPVLEALSQAKAAALQAVELDDTLADAHAALASVAAAEYDWTEARKQYRLALSCKPVSPWVRAGLAYAVVVPLGDIDEVVTLLQPALVEDPLSLSPRVFVAQALMARGLHRQAMDDLRRLIDLQPDSWLAHANLGLAHLTGGSIAAAIAAFEKTLDLAPWQAHVMGLLAGSYERAGDRKHAEQTLARLAGADGAYGISREGAAALGRASFHAVCEEFDRAADFLESLIDAHQPGLPFLLRLPHYVRFRETARGQQVLRRLNLA
jgi:serine/threonine-protein kinase